MKKLLSIMLATALVAPMLAQEPAAEDVAKTARKAMLPEAGDFFLGFSLNPFTTFIGKMFSQSGVDDSYKGKIGGQGLVSPVVSVMGGYMMTDQLAFKANIGVIVDYNNTLYNVNDDAALKISALSKQQVQDKVTTSQYGGSFSAGIEYRVGKGRVQGVFGGGLVYAFQTNKSTYSYGNAITELNQKPTTFSSSVYDYNPEPTVYNATRTVSVADGAFFHRGGLYTSAGVECFVAPKVALGFNVNLDLLYKWSSNVASVYEGYNTFKQEVDNFTNTNGLETQSGITFKTENIGANLYMHFYIGQ